MIGGIDIEAMTVWALFDSGNGSYTKGAATLKRSGGGRTLTSIRLA